MSTPTFDSLRETLSQVRRRRNRRYTIFHGSQAVIGICALILSLSLLTAWLQPPFVALLLLSLLTLSGISALLWRWLRSVRRMRSDDRELAHYVEENIPDFEQRLLTSLEFNDTDDSNRRGVSSQFVTRLWQDAEQHVEQQREQVSRVAFSRNAPLLGALAVMALGLSSLGFLLSDTVRQSGSQLLWPFAAMPASAPGLSLETLPPPLPIEIIVEPGDLRMQRGEGVNVVARVLNADPGELQLRIRSDNVNWQDLDMRQDGRGSDGAQFSHQLSGLERELVYYVSMDDGALRSEQYRISLYDLPRVQRIDVAMNYPEYTGMAPEEELDGGDLVVPEGTEVTLQVQFNKPVASAQILFDSAEASYADLPLTIDGERASVNFTVSRDAVYRIHAVDYDQLESEAPLDYYIRAIEDQPPQLVLHSPGRDQDVMPLEEVVLEVEATDDYGLSEFALHYTVIGQEEQVVNFLPDSPTRSVVGTEMIYLEDLGVQPGDFISYYLTLADNNALDGPQQVISDIYFLQVTPTDADYRRAAGGGGGQMGGGAGGDDDSALVTLQKDIIAATWKLRNEAERMSAQQFSDDVGVVAESQQQAIQRARMSIDRLSERLNFADDSYGNAVRHLNQAIEHMQEAVVELEQEQVTRALQPEQQALQFVMRAEAEINRTDVSFQQTAGGGGGGGRQQQERDDLRELFEMEMGRNENRYQTPQSAGGGGGQAQSEEASRLEELARRQENLTRAQRNLARRMEDMEEEQRRRELERLRREQEQLTAEVDRLAQQLNRQQQMQPGQPGQPGQQADAGQQQLQRALEQMREAAEAQTPAQAAARSQRALESLREEQRNLQQQQSTQSSTRQLAQNLSERGQQLRQQQRELQQELQEASREQGLGQSRQDAREDARVQDLLNRQRQQRRDLEEIERMLRAVIARADADEQALLSQAQRANRALRPLREQMESSNRVLDSGMVNLAADIERDIGEELAQLERSLQAMAPGGEQRSGQDGGDAMQAARDATALREQLEALRERAEAFQQGEGPRTVGDMRQQLAQSRELADQLGQRLEEMQAGEAGEAGGAQDAGAAAGGADRRMGGGIPAYGEAASWGYARSLGRQLSDAELEDFLNQPELLQQLLEPLFQLENELRARAELEAVERRLYAVSDEQVPEQYRRLVEAYYRALSESGRDGDSAE